LIVPLSIVLHGLQPYSISEDFRKEKVDGLYMTGFLFTFNSAETGYDEIMMIIISMNLKNKNVKCGDATPIIFQKLS
jgi:hypothetical protein